MKKKKTLLRMKKKIMTWQHLINRRNKSHTKSKSRFSQIGWVYTGHRFSVRSYQLGYNFSAIGSTIGGTCVYKIMRLGLSIILGYPSCDVEI